MRRVQHRNPCQHHLCLFVHWKCIFQTQPVTFYYISSGATIHAAPCSTFYPCAPDLSSPFWRLFGPSPGLHYPLLPPHSVPSTPHCWLLFPHHSVWRRLPPFCPNRSHEPKMTVTWLHTLYEQLLGGLLFISPIIWEQGNPCRGRQDDNIYNTNTDCVLVRAQIRIATKRVKRKFCFWSKPWRMHQRNPIIPGLKNFGGFDLLTCCWMSCASFSQGTKIESNKKKGWILIRPLHVD